MYKKEKNFIADREKEEKDIINLTINDLYEKWIFDILQKGQLLYAYHKAINNGHWPKTLQEEEKQPSIKKTEYSIVLKECIETLNNYCQQDDKKILQCINYKTFELMNILKQNIDNNSEIKSWGIFQTLHALSSNEREKKDPSFLACNNKLKEAFNNHYPDHYATKNKTIGETMSLIELVSLIWEKTNAYEIRGMWPQRYCTLEEIFLKQWLQLNDYFKRSNDKKTKKK